MGKPRLVRCRTWVGSKNKTWVVYTEELTHLAWVCGFLVSFVSSRYSVTADPSDPCPFLLFSGMTSTPLFTALISASFLKRCAFAMRAPYELARGIDDSDVSPGRPTQSVSVDDTFETTAYLSFGFGPLRTSRSEVVGITRLRLNSDPRSHVVFCGVRL
jgi:hypothetical protein